MQDVRTGAGIQARGLTKRFGPTVAVDSIDLDIAPGEVVALLGPNGAGKSTTIDLLLGLVPPDAMDVATRRAFWSAMHEWTQRGRTVMFATHYLEEADAYADRAILMAHGRIVADGPTTEVKAAVGGRTIHATVSGASAEALI